MSTVLLIVAAIIGLLIWIVFKLLKWILGMIQKSVKHRKCVRRRAKLDLEEARKMAEFDREEARFEASIAKTHIVSRQKVFDSNRKHHYETTFMLYSVNGKKTAMTVRDGSYHYDMLVGKLEE